VTSRPAEELAETLVQLADTQVDEFDLDAFLRLLADRCVRLLDVDAAALLVVEDDGEEPVIGASGETAERLELLEVANDEGPSLDSCRDGTVVVEPDLAKAADRWPTFATAALAAGFAAVHTIPLRLRSEVIGALNLFRGHPGELDPVVARIGRAMADVATIGLLHTRALRQQKELAAQLQNALTSRVIIEQAKGVVGERLGLTMDAAFTTLRSYARSHNEKLAELAGSVVDGSFDTRVLRPPA